MKKHSQEQHNNNIGWKEEGRKNYKESRRHDETVNLE
jgi:hypothetical protein